MRGTMVTLTTISPHRTDVQVKWSLLKKALTQRILMAEAIGFIKVNLNYAKAASDILSRSFTRDNMVFTQEPWINNKKIKELLSKNCKLILDSSHDSP